MNRYILFGLILLFSHTTVLALPTAKMTLKVLDEENNPIEGASAGLTFYTAISGRGPKTTGDKGLTDSGGLFTGSGESSQYVRYGANKEGYYGTGGEIRMDRVTGVLSGRWEPWNSTVEVVLKKTKNPIAMYAARINSMGAKHLPTLPVLGQFIGYDLIEGDWVVPHGLGTHRDFLFKLEKHSATSRVDHHVILTLKFENEGDGIQSFYDQPNQGSNLRSPHNAPTSGYEPVLIINKRRTATKVFSGDIREDQNYFFRVRTEKDEKGNIVSALYGKIYGAIEIGAFVGRESPTGTVFFDYYLNPNSNDTNLEFDPRNNLFTDLTDREKVRLP